MAPRLRHCRKFRSRAIAFLAIGVALSISVPAAAQEGESAVGPPAFEFSFSNPGARAMGLGSAFVALADDATAAFANPAGLTQLVEPEISIEVRSWSYSTPYTSAGRYEGAPSGFGIDKIAGTLQAESVDTLRGLSFLSYVRPGQRWSVALYRHQLAKFESHTATNGLFGGGTNCCQVRALDLVESTNFEIVSYGAAVAHRLTDRLSFGVGVQLHKSSLAIRTQSFRIGEDSIESFFAPNPFLPERVLAQIDYSLHDPESIGVSAGLLWKGRQWRFGGVYRRGPRTTFAATAIAGPGNWYGIPAGTVIEEGTAKVDFPDVYAAGAAYQTIDGRLTIGAEWDRVGYNSILRSAARSPEVDVSQQRLDDADEIHVGFEYVFLASDPLIAVRAGLWHDPNHRTSYVGNEAYDRAVLPTRGDHLHKTIGFGIAFRKVQFDIGADLSGIVNTVSASMITTF